MTDQPDSPPPGRQPAAPSPQKGQQAPAEDLSSRAAGLQAELDKIRAAAMPDAKVMLRVGEPHDSFTYGGVTVYRDPTAVPAHAVARLMGMAADAGVTLEEA